MKKTKWEYLGLIIEKGVFGFYVIDWDYECETVLNSGMPFKTRNEAELFILSKGKS